MDLLEFAESVANNTSHNLHGFNLLLVIQARQVVKENGGKLKAVGRFPENGTQPRPHSVYKNGKWTKYTFCEKSDCWLEIKM